MASWIPIILTGVLALPAEPVRGGPPAGRPGAGAGITRFIEKVAEAVNATEEQVAQLEAIAAEHQEQAEAAWADRQQAAEELRELREEMREARRGGDEERAQEIRDEMREVLGQRRDDLMRETREKIAAILTPEQLPAFEELMEKEPPGPGWGWFGGDRGPRFQGGGPPFNIHRFVRQLAQEIDPTDEQKEQLQTIAAEHIRALKKAEADAEIAREKNREELRDLDRQLRDARRAGNEEEFQAIQEKMRAILGPPPEEVAKETLGKIAAILTDEQKPKFDALVEELGAQQDRRGPGWRGEGRFDRQRGPGGRPFPDRGEL